MSATARTVMRLLDREPGAPPVREVGGYVIETNVPRPTGKGKKNRLRVAMEALAVGESFFAESTYGAAVHGIAKLIRPKVFQTQTKGNGVRVWRIE